ncbi:hypothetical protein OG535_23540 [Kitasatospora sp. NBC_00085]|uniref:hypothetical protein n=1 Tax=Kitasatospora sp. NBC_00085 TaxID=2903566 RepID=UPI0032547AA6
MSGQYPGQYGPPPGGAFPGGAPHNGIPRGASYGAPPHPARQYPARQYPAQQYPAQEYPTQPYSAQPYPVPPTQAVPALRPGMAAGPFGVPGRVLWSLVPLVTIGLLGVIPSLLLAIRRRRAYDIIGAVAFVGVFLTYLVCAGVAGGTKAPTADTIGMVAMVLMWLGAPLHFLVMDLQVIWNAGRPKPPAPAAYYAPPATSAAPPSAASGMPPSAAAGMPAAPYAPYGQAPAPGYATPASAPAPGSGPLPGPPPPGAAPATGDELRELGELLRRQAREGGRP